MATSFACPDCGCRIRPTGSTPGRVVVCPRCATRVEVPFLPRSPTVGREARAEQPVLRRGGHRGRAASRRRQVRWALALGAVALVAAATVWSVRRIASGARDGRERVLGELVEASRRAEEARDPAGAFREIEAAVIRARQIDPPDSGRLAELRERRDRLARAEVAARLAALSGLEADRAAGEARILVERGGRDPALAPLAGAIAAGSEAATLRQVEADRDHARADLAAGRGIVAFDRADRAYRHADGLRDRAAACRLRAEAEALIAGAVGRFGVLVGPTPAPPARPGPAPPADRPIEEFARPLWLDALAARGYLIEPPRSDWGSVWADRAPYRASATVVETANELYQQSQNRATQINGRFTVTERGRPVWDNRVFAQTRSPIPDLAAFAASRLATADRRDAEIERRLRDDARAVFRAQAERAFRGLPRADAAPTAPTPPVPVPMTARPGPERPPGPGDRAA